MFSTSTVRPPYWVMTSLGRWALPPKEFSAQAIRPVTLTGTSKAVSAEMTAITAAPPAMSVFMSFIDADGFSDRPPLSKVMPLPTSTTWRVAPVGAYSIVIRQGGLTEPWPTARMPPKPISSVSTVTLTPLAGQRDRLFGQPRR